MNFSGSEGRKKQEDRACTRKGKQAHAEIMTQKEKTNQKKQDELQWIERPKEEGRQSVRKKRKARTRRKNELERKRQIETQIMNFNGSKGRKKQEGRACTRKGKQAHAERMNQKEKTNQKNTG